MDLALGIAIKLLVDLLYWWLTFKIAVILASRVRQFSLRNLLIAMAVASVFIAALVQIGGLISVSLALITLVASVVGVVVGIGR